MSISNEDNFEKFSPSTATTSFDWGIYYFADTDINVAVEDSAGDVTNLVLNAGTDGFSVQATNGDRRQGATITTTETYNSGDLITISRVVPLTQEYDLKAGAEINPTALNKALDRTVAQSQQLENDGSRHLEHPITDPVGLNYEAPTVANRASKALGYDASGNVVALYLASSGTISVDTNKGLSLTSNIISGKADDTSIEFDGSGNFSIKDLGVDTAQLAAGAVTTAKIDADAIDGTKVADLAIDTEHLATDAVETAKILDDAVTTAKIADANVTNAKLGSDIGVWTDWTPVITQGANTPTFSGYAKYCQIGKMVTATMDITFSSAGDGTNAVILNGLPTAKSGAAVTGSGVLYNYGTAYYAFTTLDGPTNMNFVVGNVGSVLGVNPTFTIASLDTMTFSVTYEVA